MYAALYNAQGMPVSPSPQHPESGESTEEALVVQIYDQSFRLGSSSADPEQIRQAAAYLDDKMRALAAKRGRGVALELAILAAMEVADEVLSTQQRREQLLADADERIDQFTQTLEATDHDPATSDGSVE
jgi:cell division protein ZapA